MPLDRVLIVAASALYTSMTSLSTSHDEGNRSSMTLRFTASSTYWNRFIKVSSYLRIFATNSGSTMGFSASYERLAFRYEQEEGQSISISRLVPQQTAHICVSLAGQYRLPDRMEHNGHIAISAEVCDNRN